MYSFNRSSRCKTNHGSWVVVFATFTVILQLTTIETTYTGARGEPSAHISTDRRQYGDKIEKKITIIVGDEESTVVSSSSIINQSSSAPETDENDCPKSSGKPRAQRGRNKPPGELVRHHINETTKAIIVDKDSEQGLLIGEIKTGYGPKLATRERRASEIQLVANHSELAANYSVYLVSRYKNHIAIQLDIEEIDFEPIINCEYQELRFGIVGEISKQLFNRKENNSLANGDQSKSDLSPGVDGEKTEATAEQESFEDPSSKFKEDNPNAPPLPVSEAMAMLLNSPLNKTITDQSADANDFKIIDSTIDYLYQETCRLIQQSNCNETVNERTGRSRKAKPWLTNDQQSRNDSIRRRQRSHKRRRGDSTRSRSGSGGKGMRCQQSSVQFRDSFAKGMNDYFEWDNFKIICGKTKQLIIPMRSMKLSVYSDEFAPNSKFVIRYRFISDPSLLPAMDNKRYYCRNRNVIDLKLKCNGYDDCGDASDESIKVCGYPSGCNGETNSIDQQARKSSSTQTGTNTSGKSINGQASAGGDEQKRLQYPGTELVKCCQSSDWLNLLTQGQTNQAMNLQSLIGESMKLFSSPSFAPTKSEASKNNGHKRRYKRIVGGNVAQRGAWPGQVSLQYELLEPLCHFCAGTLIHPMYVLTAGHCITKDGLNRGIKVVLGAHDLRQLNGNHIQVRYVDDVLVYPGVDVKHLSFDWENDMNNDIALLRLNAPVLITPHVAPACLPSFNTPPAVNTSCRSIGWGQTHGSGSSNLLKHLPLKVVDSSVCSKELLDRDNGGEPTNLKIPTGATRSKTARRGRFASEVEPTNVDMYSNLTMVCVNNNLGHGICQGDSGGPLYCDRVTPSGEHCTEIYGVASFIIQYATVGAMCAVENLPGIFGEVSSKTEWISSTIRMFEQSYRMKY